MIWISGVGCSEDDIKASAHMWKAAIPFVSLMELIKSSINAEETPPTPGVIFWNTSSGLAYAYTSSIHDETNLANTIELWDSGLCQQSCSRCEVVICLRIGLNDREQLIWASSKRDQWHLACELWIAMCAEHSETVPVASRPASPIRPVRGLHPVPSLVAPAVHRTVWSVSNPTLCADRFLQILRNSLRAARVKALGVLRVKKQLISWLLKNYTSINEYPKFT